jgi:YfiH family protein
MIRVADCVPVLLADVQAGVVGAAHAGRQGVALDIVGRTVERMRALGADRITAWVGPHVCGRCYEVPEQMRDEVAALVPATRAQTTWGTPSLDLGAGVLAQLGAAGVEAVAVERCTLEDPALHSYRRDGAASGRIAGLVWLA